MKSNSLPLVLRSSSITILATLLGLLLLLSGIVFFRGELIDLLSLLESEVPATEPSEFLVDENSWRFPLLRFLFTDDLPRIRSSTFRWPTHSLTKFFLAQTFLAGILFSWVIWTAKYVNNLCTKPLRDLLKSDEIKETQRTRSFPEVEILESALLRVDTELKEIQCRLLSTQRKRRELLSSLTHDLRTPMTSMESAAYLLQSNPNSVGTATTYHKLLLSGLNRQETLVGQLKNLFLESPEADSAFELVTFSGLLSEVLLLVEPLRTKKNIHFEKSFSNEDTLFASKDILERALLNLLDNSLRHAPYGTSIAITFSTTEDTLFFSVINQTSKDSANTSSHSRPTLGIEIVHEAARIHHGRFEIRQSLSSHESRFQLLRTPRPPFKSKEEPNTPQEKQGVVTVTPQHKLLLSLYTVSLSIVFLLSAIANPLIAFLIASGGALLLCWALPRLPIKVSITPLITVAFVLISFLASHSISALPSAFVGFSAIVALGIIASSENLRPTVRALLVLGIVLWSAIIAPRPPWFFLLGLLCGLWITTLSLLRMAVPIARRAGGWLGGLLLIGITFISILGTSVHYLLFFDALRASLSPRFDKLIVELANEVPIFRPNDDHFSVEALAEILLRSPFVDFMANLPDSVAGAKRAPKQYGFPPKYFRSSLSLTELAPQSLVLGRIEFLGDLPIRLIQRDLSAVLPPFVFLQISLLGVPSFLFALLWSNSFSRRLASLRQGMERFSDGQIAEPIHLSGCDEVADIARTLSQRGKKVVDLQTEFQKEQERAKLFLLFGLETIETAMGELRQILESTGSILEHSLLLRVATLRRTIERIFEIVYLEFSGFLPKVEQVNLGELIEEEVHEFQRKTPQVEIKMELISSSRSEFCEAALLIRTLHYVFETSTRMTGCTTLMIQEVREKNFLQLRFVLGFGPEEVRPATTTQVLETMNTLEKLELRAIESRWAANQMSFRLELEKEDGLEYRLTFKGAGGIERGQG